MPNGWYPVPGLDVVLINSTEQHNPRYEWGQSWSRLWAMRIYGEGARASDEPFQTDPRGSFEFEDLVGATQGLLRRGDMGSVLTVDFEHRRGAACGSFVVYGFGDERVEVLHDHSLLAIALAELGEPTAEQREKLEAYRSVVTTMVTVVGLESGGQERTYEFSFESFDQLVVSSMVLHHDPHWPPKSILDVPAVALAQPSRSDVLLALWRAPDS